MNRSLRLPPDMLARWKATGPGWQTRMAELYVPKVTIRNAFPDRDRERASTRAD